MNSGRNFGLVHGVASIRALVIVMSLLLFLGHGAFAQNPEITVRFANPVFDCAANTYCADVEFQLNPADPLGRELFGMNVRFFYDSGVFDTAIAFGDFQGGYGVSGTPAGTVLADATGPWFGFGSAATYVNAYVQLYDLGAAPIYISNSGWTKLFSICFNVIDPTSLGVASFCPSIVWDLEANPADGGFNPTSQGVVMSVVLVRGSTTAPVEERVAQYNWTYDGPGTAPYGYPVPTVCLDTYCPDIALTKTAIEVNGVVPVPFGYTMPGDVITYEILVTNTGNVGLGSVLVSDPDATTGPTYVSGDLNSDGVLDLTETWVYTATRVITLADINAGSFTNVATVSGVDPESTLVSAFDDETVPMIPMPGIMVEKVAFQLTYSFAGEIITYGIVVTNTGNVPLDTISVVDPQATTGPTYVAGDLNLNNILDVGEFWGYEATYQITQADVDAGAFMNTVTATGYEPLGSPVSDEDYELVIALQQPNIAIDKAQTSGPNPVTAAGQVIGYTIVVTNTGNISLTDVMVSDLLPDGTPGVLAGPVESMTADGILEVGETWTYTISYTVTLTDLMACTDLVNTATVMTYQMPSPISDDAVTGVSYLTIVNCPVNRTIEGCTTADITGPVYSEVVAPSSYAEFSDLVNQGSADSCGIESVTYVDVASGVCPIVVTRTWTLMDVAGTVASCDQTITVTDTTDPVAPTAPADAQYACVTDVPPAGLLTATDNCSADITVTGVDTDNGGTGCISSPLIITRTWTFADDCGNSVSVSQTITVIDDVDPVAPLAPADAQYSCPTEVPPAGALTATDNCSTDITVVGVDSSNGGSGCTSDPLIITRTWTFVDDCGNSASVFQTITVVDTIAPVLNGVPANETVECDSVPGPATVTATDNCDPDVSVNYFEYIMLGSCPQSYMIERSWSATDECGNTASAMQIITVVDTTAPVLEGVPADETLECTDLVPVPAVVTATDNCDAAPAVSLEEITIPGSCPQNYVIERTWTAIDACGNEASATQTITVSDTTAPVLEGVPADVALDCTDPIPDQASVTATDNCDLNPVVSFIQNIIPGTCPQNYVIERTWTATDACGNEASETQMITVSDTTAPALEGVPANAALDCTELIPGPASVTATDNCDPLPQVLFMETIIPGTCPQNYTIARTWTAVDACGNASLPSVQMIMVSDTTAPTLSNIPLDESVECDTIPDPSSVTAVDECDPAPQVLVTENIIPGSCPQNYVIERTWTAVDACGNQSLPATQMITVSDTTAPTITCPADPQVRYVAADATGYTAAGVEFDYTSLDDNCAIPVATNDINFSDTLAGYEFGFGDTVVTWTATDECGNTDSCSFTVRVLPTLLSIVKTAVDTTYSAEGDVISYTFTVANTGDVVLTNVMVVDPLATVSGGPIASLAPGEVDTTTFTATYVITQDDVDAGSFINTATVEGYDPDGNLVTALDSETVYAIQNPGIGITKIADPATYSTAGDVISYTITLVNTGNVSLENVVVADPGATTGPSYTTGDADGDNRLDVDETWIYVATYTITAADVAAGSYTNTATGSGQALISDETVTVSATSEATVISVAEGEGEGEPVEGEGEPVEGEGEPVEGEGEPVEGEGEPVEGEGEPVEGEGEPVEGEGEPVEGEGECEYDINILIDNFDDIDTNGDGRLSIEEIRVVIDCLTDEQFVELDRNNDGYVTQRELVGAPRCGGFELFGLGTLLTMLFGLITTLLFSLFGVDIRPGKG